MTTTTTAPVDLEPPSMSSVALPTEQVIRNPFNPRARVQPGDVTSLVETITAHDLLGPITVVTRQAWLEANPGHADELDEDGEYVLVCGERRTMACRVACRVTIDGIIRDDLAPAEVAIPVMLAENGDGRQPFTAMEEARAFQALHDRGKSERAIAKEVGVSPGQVNKRRSLTRLPDAAAAAVDAKTLAIADALTLLELPKEQIEQAWNDAQESTYWTVRQVVDQQLKENAKEEEVTALRDKLTRLGIEIVESPQHVLGPHVHQHRLLVDDPEDLPNPTDVIAQIGSVGDEIRVLYYTRTTPLITNLDETSDDDLDEDEDEDEEKPTRGASSGSTEEDTAEQARAEALREEAIEAAATRAEACQRLVRQNPLPIGLAMDIVADTVLANDMYQEWDAVRNALRWYDKCPLDLDAIGDDELEVWLGEQVETGEARCLAMAFTLAQLEHDLTQPIRRGWSVTQHWTALQKRHVQRLIDHAGHHPNAYETTQLTAS